MDQALARAVELIAARAGKDGRGYPWGLPAIRALAEGLRLHPKVTYLIGENGSGKSTVLEAIAVAAGMNPEGGSSSFAFSTRDSHSPLGVSARLIPAAEDRLLPTCQSLFTAATYLDQLRREDERSLHAYGGASLHEQSHGESFLARMRPSPPARQTAGGDRLRRERPRQTDAELPVDEGEVPRPAPGGLV